MPNNEEKLDAVEFTPELEQEVSKNLETLNVETDLEAGSILNRGHQIFSVSPLIILAAASVIKPDATVINVTATVGGGAVTLTSNPSILDGVNGQLLILRGSSATDTITLTDGNGMLLAGSVTLGLNDTITLYYDGLKVNDWIEIGRNLNTVQTYAASNVTTDRTYDADATSTAELADVLGTLIADLRTWGIIK